MQLYERHRPMIHGLVALIAVLIAGIVDVITLYTAEPVASMVLDVNITVIGIITFVILFLAGLLLAKSDNFCGMSLICSFSTRLFIIVGNWHIFAYVYFWVTQAMMCLNEYMNTLC